MTGKVARWEYTKRLDDWTEWSIGSLLSDNDTQSLNQFDLRYVVDLPTWERRERKELLAQIHAPNVHRRDIQTVASMLEHGISLALYACMGTQNMIPF